MTALTLARPDDLERLLPLVAACHAETGIAQEASLRRSALLPLLEGSPHGAIYLVGPARAPIGYVVLSFGWSVEFAGRDGYVDELYIRPAVRGRGIATEVMSALPRTLAAAGLRALHLEVRQDAARTRRLYERLGYRMREACCLMTHEL